MNNKYIFAHMSLYVSYLDQIGNLKHPNRPQTHTHTPAPTCTWHFHLSGQMQASLSPPWGDGKE